jgi:hypothetical protein
VALTAVSVVASAATAVRSLLSFSCSFLALVLCTFVFCSCVHGPLRPGVLDGALGPAAGGALPAILSFACAARFNFWLSLLYLTRSTALKAAIAPIAVDRDSPTFRRALHFGPVVIMTI